MKEFKFTKTQLFFIGSFITSLYMLPYIILGENMYICDHDFLDSHQAYLKVLKDNDSLWSLNGIFPSMDGVPVAGFDSLYPLRLLIYYLFEPYTAFLIGDWIARIVGFIGMFLLLNYYSGNNYKKQLSALICSIMFGFLWFHDGYFELGSAGYPLLLFNFLCLKNNKNILVNCASLIFIASFSSIFHLSFFACILMSGYFIYLYLKEKIIYSNLLLGICVLGLSSIIFSYNLFLNFFLSDVVSHRVEFQGGSNLLSCIKGCISLLFRTQEHTGVLDSIPIIILLFISFFLEHTYKNKHVKQIVVVILSIVIFWGIYQLTKYTFPTISIIQKFQADRFYFMLPSLWIILLYFIIVNMNKDNFRKTMIFVIIIFTFGGIVKSNPEFAHLIKHIAKSDKTYPTYKQFYDTALFNKIKKDVPVSSKTCSIGFYPSVLSYNGFYTLDGYYVSYPLEYKHRFRKVIAKELEKSPEIKDYFDNWGNRCYLFSSELGLNFLYGKNTDIREVKNLEIDTVALKNLGCEYVLSAVQIQNFKNLNLKYINSYTNENSYWKIYVYKL